MKFFIGFFRQYPTSTGLLCLILISHLFESKDTQTPLLALPKDFIPVFFFYVMGMLIYMLFILPQIEAQKREKETFQIGFNSNPLSLFAMIVNENSGMFRRKWN